MVSLGMPACAASLAGLAMPSSVAVVVMLRRLWGARWWLLAEVRAKLPGHGLTRV